MAFRKAKLGRDIMGLQTHRPRTHVPHYTAPPGTAAAGIVILLDLDR